MDRAKEKDWPKRPSDCQVQEAGKKTDRAIIPATEAVHVPAHLVPLGCPHAKQLCHLHAQLSLEQSCHRQTMSCVYVCRVTLVMSNSLRPCGMWPARLLCQGILPGKNTGVYWPIWLPYPSRALHFLLPQVPTPLNTWCCLNPCSPSSCTTSTPGTQWG